jgi:hypothetical protein
MNCTVGDSDLFRVQICVVTAQPIERLLHQHLLVMDEVQRIALDAAVPVEVPAAYQLRTGHVGSFERIAQRSHEWCRTAVRQHPRYDRCRGEEVGPRVNRWMGVESTVPLRAQ